MTRSRRTACAGPKISTKTLLHRNQKPYGQTGAAFPLLTLKPESTANPHHQNPFRKTAGVQEGGSSGRAVLAGDEEGLGKEVEGELLGGDLGASRGASLGELGGGDPGWVGRDLRWSGAVVQKEEGDEL